MSRYDTLRRAAREAWLRARRERSPLVLELTLALYAAYEAQEKAYAHGTADEAHAAAEHCADVEERLRDAVKPPEWTMTGDTCERCGVRTRETLTGRHHGLVWCPTCSPPEWAIPRQRYRPSRDCSCGTCDLCWLVAEIGEEGAREIEERRPVPEIPLDLPRARGTSRHDWYRHRRTA